MMKIRWGEYFDDFTNLRENRESELSLFQILEGRGESLQNDEKERSLYYQYGRSVEDTEENKQWDISQVKWIKIEFLKAQSLFAKGTKA